MTSARVLAQAKINLLLRVLARGASGYHNLETVFLRLELGDDVTIRTGGRQRSLDCDESALPVKGMLGAPEHNLAFRAAESFRALTGWPSGWSIEITKRIPVGGGLGGGSADAGAVLRALNAMAPAPITDGELARLALALGSDVPFLASTDAMALAYGRGEQLHALPALPRRDIALGIFPFGVSTRDAFAWLASSRDGDSVSVPMVTPALLSSWDRVAAIATNDFEPVVAPRFPPIARTLAAMRDAGSPIALLCGSGATVLGVFDARIPLELAKDVSVLWTRSANSVVAVHRMG